MRIDAPAAAAAPARLPIVDAARGTALLAMFTFHFAWDLDYYQLISTDIGASRPWGVFARLTAGSFLTLVGVSLVLARRGGFRPRPYLRRLAVVGGAAALVTLGTWLLMPEDFIYFGILHCIAASSVLALPFLRRPAWVALAAALFCFAAPSLFASPVFDAPWLRWLGLMTYFPRTNDYVPLLPWFGAVLVGIAGARLALPSADGAAWARWRPMGALSRLLVWGGRHSLGIYLLHQPVFLGALFVAAWLAGPSTPAWGASFRRDCATSCREAGTAAEACEASCGCVLDGLRRDGTGRDALRKSMLGFELAENERQRLLALSRQCRREPPGP